MNRIHIKRTRLGYWKALNPDETLATIDTHTHVRAWTREGVIKKAIRRWFRPKPDRWEEVLLGGSALRVGEER